jgi:hypothetical protein
MSSAPPAGLINDSYPTGVKQARPDDLGQEKTMLHPVLAQDIVSGQRKAMLAQAAAIGRARAARRALRISHGRPVPSLPRWLRVLPQPRPA